MTRKLKALGLTLAAVFAMSAVAVSAAQAAEFHSSVEHTILNAGQTTTHEFTAGSGFGGITCTTATFEGTATATTTSALTITPAYSGCTDSLGRTVDVNINGTKYEFTPSGVVHIRKGTAGISLQITNSAHEVKCTVTIGEQEGVGPISYTNEGGKVLVESAATNIKSTTSGGLLNCGISNGEHSNGTYTGSSRVTGTNTEGGAAELRVE